MKVSPWLVTVALISGCITTPAPSTVNTWVIKSKVIDRPRDAVWNASVPELEKLSSTINALDGIAVPDLKKQYFLIQKFDKAAGVVCIRYTGDPERYVDCGRITSTVEVRRGARHYDFPAAASAQEYEFEDMRGRGTVTRTMFLRAGANLVFEELGTDRTRVSVKARYVLNREISVSRVGAGQVGMTGSGVVFNSGGSASFPAVDGREALDCAPTGEFEREILSATK
jgi:hypothetical protein